MKPARKRTSTAKCKHAAWEQGTTGVPLRCADCKHVFSLGERAAIVDATLKAAKRPRGGDGLEWRNPDDLLARWARDADAFRKLAAEIEEGLRRGAYDSFKLDFSERRRKRTEAEPTPPGMGPRVPLKINITYSGRPVPR